MLPTKSAVFIDNRTRGDIGLSSQDHAKQGAKLAVLYQITVQHVANVVRSGHRHTHVLIL